MTIALNISTIIVALAAIATCIITVRSTSRQITAAGELAYKTIQLEMENTKQALLLEEAMLSRERLATSRAQKIFLEMDLLRRLSQNLERGGHTDEVIRKDMGAEAAALLNALGPRLLPRTWTDKRQYSEDQIRENFVSGTLADGTPAPAFKIHTMEIALAQIQLQNDLEKYLDGATDDLL